MLVRGAAWNQLSQILPAAAAIVILPRLVHGLGMERFGVLSLAWMLIGYFMLLDLGTSGALTRLVSERMAAGRQDEVAPLVWTALAITVGVGIVGAACLAALAPWLVGRVLHVPPALRGEALGLTWVLVASLPVVTTTAALSGVLAAQQRFGVLSAIRVPMGILTYVAPLLVLTFTSSLLAIGLALAGVRLLGGLAHLAACLKGVPGLRAGIRVRRAQAGAILGFGSWMTVSAVVSPLMAYLDRFVIGAMLSLAMVAYYTTSYDLTARFALLFAPVVSVLFPAFAATYDHDRARTARLYDWGLRAVAALIYPVVLVCVLFAPEGLDLWLGHDFAAHGATVLRVLALGIFINALAQVALALVQSSGRPDLGARLHLTELPFYLLAVWLLIRARGIEGAALAWTLRVAVDALVLFVMAARRLGPEGRAHRATLATGLAGLVLLLAGAFVPGLTARIAFGAVQALAFAAIAWRFVINPGRRVLLEARAARGA